MRKIFLALLLAFFVFSTGVTPVFAQQMGQTVMLNKDQQIKGDYFANGGTVTVLGTVDGDSYVAGGTVTIDGDVKGDIIAGGGTVTVNGSAQNVRVTGGTITINGNIAKNITVLGGTVTLESNAKIGGSIVAAGGTITILSPVGKGATIGGGQVTINNTVNGDINAGVGQLTLGPQTKINGNLNYTSEQKVHLSEGATITGKVNQKAPQQNKHEMQQKVAAGIGTMIFIFSLANFISLFLVGLLLILISPNFFRRVSEGVIEKPWWSLGIGFLTVIVVPIIIAILFATIIGIPLALIILLIYLVVLYISKLFVIFLIGDRIGRSINSKMHMVWLFLIGLIIYQILVLIPIIGWLIDVLAILFGLGSLILQKKRLYLTLRRDKTI